MKTTNTQREKTFTVATTSHEQSRFTVILPCLADGTKLKPMITFKHKTQPKEKFPPGVVVHHYPMSWMDMDGIKLWTKKVWCFRPGSMVGTRSLLVWDLFRAHLVDPVKRAPHCNNTEIAVILAGLTSIIQPIDICLNKLFKDRLREKWTTWMLEGEKALTPVER